MGRPHRSRKGSSGERSPNGRAELPRRDTCRNCTPPGAFGARPTSGGWEDDSRTEALVDFLVIRSAGRTKGNQPMPHRIASPRIESVVWGQMEVEGFPSGTDMKLWPGGGRSWDWRETDTHHVSGIQIADVEELIDHGANVIVLSRGMRVDARDLPRDARAFRAAPGCVSYRRDEGSRPNLQRPCSGRRPGGWPVPLNLLTRSPAAQRGAAAESALAAAFLRSQTNRTLQDCPRPPSRPLPCPSPRLERSDRRLRMRLAAAADPTLSGDAA